jgi:glycosyltransferase involved in cell wall biosynthesis
VSGRSLSYAVVTPARDEAENLPRLAGALAAQTRLPHSWTIVDNGSSDATSEVADGLAREYPWIHARTAPTDPSPTRAAPIVRAFESALGEVDPSVDVVVKLDADVSFEADHFERLLAAFEQDRTLGIVSGSCYELDLAEWKQRHVTGDHVWGAARAYRRDCLLDVLPLEARLGWDGIDELKAALQGWSTRTLLDVPFRHYRREGEREGARWQTWVKVGRASHYLDYRVGYLLLRTLHWARKDIAALGMLRGYFGAALNREPRCKDEAIRAYVRQQQTLRNLPLRMREALGRRPA